MFVARQGRSNESVELVAEEEMDYCRSSFTDDLGHASGIRFVHSSDTRGYEGLQEYEFNVSLLRGVHIHSWICLWANVARSSKVSLLSVRHGDDVLTCLSEMYGRTIVYHVTNILFVGFTIGCALSTNMGMLIAFRFLTGVCGSCPMYVTLRQPSGLAHTLAVQLEVARWLTCSELSNEERQWLLGVSGLS